MLETMFIMTIWLKLRLYVLIHKDHSIKILISNLNPIETGAGSFYLRIAIWYQLWPTQREWEACPAPTGSLQQKGYFKLNHSAFFVCSEDKAS